MIAIDVTPIDSSVETYRANPEDLVVRCQILGERKKSIQNPKPNHYECECLSSLFLAKGLRRYEQYDPVGNVPEGAVPGDVGVCGCVKCNLCTDQQEKQERWKVKRVRRKLHLA